MGALLRDGRIETHRTAADTAVLGVLVPEEQFEALAGLQVVLVWQFVETLAQGAHLIEVRGGRRRIGRERLLDAKGLVAVDVHDGRPRFDLDGGFLGNLVAVGGLLDDQVALAEYEVFHFDWANWAYRANGSLVTN